MDGRGFSLGQLFPGAFPDDASRVVGGVTADSRKVARGDVFVALAGAKANGAQFITDAVSRGAAAIVSGDARPEGIDPAIAFATVPEPRLARVDARRRQR
jgi:UDP-N-acetylmuramoyl-L-alanyl-D-glutamate--2,6-diaminopimelate ligase